VTIAAWASLACLGACIAVQTEEQSFRVGVISKNGHAVGKASCVRHDLSGCLVPTDLPAVVDIEVFVSFSGESSGDEQICGLLDGGFVDVAGEVVPGVPSHWRSSAETVV
jgi:hypothetical protein